ncbi:MAG: hypothetical protein ACOC3V_05645 [bacterium]
MESFKEHKKLEIASNFINTIAPELMYHFEDEPESIDEKIDEYVELGYKIAEKLVNKFEL